MKAVKVPLKELNNVRLALMEDGLMNMDYKIKTDSDFGYIPVDGDVEGFDICEVEMEALKKYPKDFTSLLDDDVKASFDIIGDVVIVEIPENLQSKKLEIGKAVLEFTKRRTVFMKKGAVHGTIRVRDLELIGGVDDSVTIYKEHGVRLKLDVRKVYFSPRLATERKRVSDSVCDGERILDMFAGIGPFSILIAKNNSVDVTSVDINSSAIRYLVENIKLNKLEGRIKALCSDVSEVSFKGKFDRIIMNLPGLAYSFLDLAMNLIEDGGIINYYEFSDGYEQGIKRLEDAAKKKNKKVRILNKRKVKSTSPGMWHISIDAKLDQ